MKKYLLFFLVFFQMQLFAQQRITISGSIRDAKTGEDIIGATVLIKERPKIAASTNTYGFYSISLPAGNYHLITQSFGYISQVKAINLISAEKMDFALEPLSGDLEEVIVSSERKNENVTSIRMGLQKLDVKDLNAIPVIFGEKDVLKTIQLLPGIKSAGEGNGGFNVRGGAVDQNLLLLDEATVYNASHLMGFFSVFNSDAIKDVTVYKGNEPAEYGGRLSSVLDIKMNDGNDKKFGVNGGLGLISSRLNVQGPIVKDKGSFIVSARRTYADVFLGLSNDATLKGSKLYFYDMNVKANYRINDKNRIFLSGYFGKDEMAYKKLFGINWGNNTGTLRWNHLFSDRLFSNTSLIYSNYDYKIRLDLGDGNNMNIISRIRDYSLKQDFQFYIHENSTLKLGFNVVNHTLIPGAITAGDAISLKSLTNKYAWENTAYISSENRLSDNLSLEYGARFNSFSLMGPGNFYSYDALGNVTDTTGYSKGDFVKTYFHLEPRASLNYKLEENSSLKASYARNTQNLHLLSNSTSGSPTDLWIPSSNLVKPEISDQVSLGYYRNFKNNLYEFSAEVYYKNLQNQIDYKDGAEIDFSETVESQILFGKGRAYGLELFLKKKYGSFNGWISYTLSRTERKFDGINQGKYYPARQDRTHDVSIVGIYNLNKKWTFSSAWLYSTGNAVTFPCGKYQVDGKTMFYYTNRNADRMPAYHRLDLGATYTISDKSSWSFSLYNAYGHDNAYMILFRDKASDPTKTEAVQVTLFKAIPSVTYNFKF